MMPYGSFSAAHEAVKTFVVDHLLANSLSTNAPDVLNIAEQFNQFLMDNGFGPLRASEETEKQETLISLKLEEELEEWHALGVPTPIDYVDSNNNILLTWKHGRFSERNFDSRSYRTAEFVSVYNWLLTLQERQFLFACVLYLKQLGCDPIFVTDGSGDMGVDCIGKVSIGPFRSLAVFVQSKTMQRSQGRIAGSTLRQEYAKFVMLKRSEKYIEYLRELSAFDGQDGSGEVFFFVTNGEFKSDAQKAANQLGIVLRSKRQMAFFFSLAYTFEEIEGAFKRLTIPAGPDLDRNLSGDIELVPYRRTQERHEQLSECPPAT